MRARRLTHICLLLSLVGASPPPLSLRATQATEDHLSDADFWWLVTSLSEPGGTFPQQLMSNEDSAQAVIPALKRTIPTGGVYVGVGSEQNFTYIAALRPRIAFIVDIRRENLLEMLMYKALFELASDRGAFVSRLFSRPAQSGIDVGSTVTTLFERYAAIEPSPSLFADTRRRIVDRLVMQHGIALTATDQATIGSMMQRFMTAGPGAQGYGDLNPAFADLMTATDFEGHQESFLASDDAYRAVRRLHMENLIVPVVGDFAGDKALKGVGEYLRAHQATVDAFYLSNVERYLFEQGAHGRQFYANVSALPLAANGVFIRSVTRDISARLEIDLPEKPTKWWTFVAPIADTLDGLATGRVRTYADLFRR